MILLEKKIGYSRDSVHWIDKQNNRYFRRVVGGIHWPGVMPGYFVIVGELDTVDPLLDERHLYLVCELNGAEVIGRDLVGFIRRVSELRGIYDLENVYGDPSRKSVREVLSQFNETIPDKKNGLSIEKAPLIEDPRCFEYCIQIVRKHLVEGRKTLHLGPDSRLPGILASAGDGVMTGKPDEFPAIAALGYAVGALDTWKPFDQSLSQRQEIKPDIFTYCRTDEKRPRFHD